MTEKKAYNIIAFLFLGLVLGLFVKYVRQLTFDFEVSVFDMFALCVTVALAWWVAEKLEKDSDKERCEKDIIIEKLKSMDALVEKLNNIIEDDDVISYTRVTSIIDSIDAHSNRIMDQINNHYPSVVENAQNADYSTELNQLDTLCTDDTDGGLVTNIENGTTVCLYSPERKEEIGSCSNQLSDKLFNLEILINRA